KAAVLLVGQRGADRRWRAITDATAARVARPLVWFAEVPEPARPNSGFAVIVRDQRPIFVPNHSPQFGRNTRRAHRTGIPGESSRVPKTCTGAAAGLGEFGAALLVDAFAVTCDQTLDGFDERRHRGLTICSDREIDLRHPPEILIVRSDIEIAASDR